MPSITMPGAVSGLKFLFKPDFRKLYHYQIWSSAAVQVFFSLGPGFGVLIAYASYSDNTENRQNPKLYSIIVSLINAATSLLCALVVYSGLGYLSLKKNVTMDSFSEHGQSLVFVVYPELIATIKAAPLFSFVFFVMVFLLGLDSVYAGIEGMHAAIASEYRIAQVHEYMSRFCLIALCFVLSIPSITAGGKYVIDFMDTYGVSPSIMFVVFLEVCTVSYVYGTKKFQNKIESILGEDARPGCLFVFAWKYIVPSIVACLYFLSFAYFDLPDDIFGPRDVTERTKKIGYALNCCTLLPIPIYALLKLAKIKKKNVKK
ncbi:hypothetical protein ACOME3_007260 [Neoechinorhynchus agilis]